jgi:hypothetical protein
MDYRRVAYVYDCQFGEFSYGDHPFQPYRVKLAHELIIALGLYQ